MAITKKLYVYSLITAVLAMAVIFGIVKYWDDSRLAQVKSELLSSQQQVESTRLLFLYSQMQPEKDPHAFCKLVDFNLRLQLDKGFLLIQQLREYEKANLLSDYESTRKNYYLSNFELWLLATQQNEKCSSIQGNTTVAIFFTHTKTFCSDCIVQGNLLSDISQMCPKLRVITLADDLDLPPITYLTQKYGIQNSPSILANSKVLSGLKTKEEIKKFLSC